MFFLLNAGERQSFIIKQNLFSFMLVYIDLIKHFSVLIKYSFFCILLKVVIGIQEKIAPLIIVIYWPTNLSNNG